MSKVYVVGVTARSFGDHNLAIDEVWKAVSVAFAVSACPGIFKIQYRETFISIAAAHLRREFVLPALLNHLCNTVIKDAWTGNKFHILKKPPFHHIKRVYTSIAVWLPGEIDINSF